MYKRLISLDLPSNTSCFLWGARKIGKSTFLKRNFPDAVTYDLLKSDVYLKLLNKPSLLREELIAKNLASDAIVIIDEVQKIPILLDEVHWLIENLDLRFILCGSSARKLKRGQANMLGGRAWRYEMFPLVSQEVDGFDLLRALNNGLIPSHYETAFPTRSLDSYIKDYLKEEILEEALTRNIRAFSKFLECVAISHGEMLNYSRIASDVGVDAKTVKSYFEILVDTLVGYFLEPYTGSALSRKDLLSYPKFYLFDSGVVAYLKKLELKQLAGKDAGNLFEGFIYHELRAYLSYTNSRREFSYLRTYAGIEVDFVLDNGDLLIETKISDKIRKDDLRGLNYFAKDFSQARKILVCMEATRRNITQNQVTIEIYPYQEFLKELWAGSLFS
jgi:predicted AAA+ superfamily ATPase